MEQLGVLVDLELGRSNRVGDHRQLQHLAGCSVPVDSIDWNSEYKVPSGCSNSLRLMTVPRPRSRLRIPVLLR